MAGEGGSGEDEGEFFHVPEGSWFRVGGVVGVIVGGGGAVAGEGEDDGGGVDGGIDAERRRRTSLVGHTEHDQRGGAGEGRGCDVA